ILGRTLGKVVFAEARYVYGVSRTRIFQLALALSPVIASACSSSSSDPPPPTDPEPCARAGLSAQSRMPTGSADGHADPFGAKGAKQARAGRIRDAALVKQPADARQKVHAGDYLLINEKIAAVIEAARPSDGYAPFGGELLAIEQIADDGTPSGTSEY